MKEILVKRYCLPESLGWQYYYSALFYPEELQTFTLCYYCTKRGVRFSNILELYVLDITGYFIYRYGSFARRM